MDLDLATLPIPDWGLRCPRCDYALRGLPTHRCPECGADIDIGRLVHSWTRLRDPTFAGRELPIPDWGLHCGDCRYPLRGLPTHTCPECGAELHPEQARPRGVWFLVEPQQHPGLIAPVVEMMLARERIPYVAVDQQGILEITLGSRMIGARLFVACEFFLDFCWHVRRLQEQLARDAVVGRSTWRCAHCGEDVPGHFELCWNCQTPRNRE
ncbi:MAG: hypothetical protein AB7Q17_11820 [Phycisphaerae bacterium]